MKIGIDIRNASSPKNGKGWYTFYLIRELLILDKKNEYLLYTNKITADVASFIGAHIKVIHKHQFLWHFAVMKDFIRSGGELFFAPTSFIIPAFLPRRVKSIITVHDLIAFLYPHFHESKATILEHLFFRRALKKTAHVLVPSENTKKDLMKMLLYPEEKITVTPLGVDENFLRHGKIVEFMTHVRKKYKLPAEFIFTVSGLEPRKNIEMLVNVIASAAKQSSLDRFPNAQHDIPLVIVGGKGWQSKNLQKKIAEQRDKIIHIEHCGQNELSALYRLAKVFVYPSLYEGFGLPPLEAMASGCPVICSNAASLPEICGDAALLFNPKNSTELQQALEKVLVDKKLRTELLEKGLEQAKKFSWRHTAKLTLKTFNMLQ